MAMRVSVAAPADKPLGPTSTHFVPSNFWTVALLPSASSLYITNAVPLLSKARLMKEAPPGLNRLQE
jgi:hypothetical protein